MTVKTFVPKVRALNTRKLSPPPKPTDPIYSSAEYRAWRSKVIARAHRRCQDPQHVGSHEPGARLYADHIHELRDGGAPFDVGNGMARCASCHSAKTARARAARR